MAIARCAPDVRAQAINDLLKADGGAEAIQKLARSIVETKGADLGINTMIRQAMKPTWGQAIMQLRINGLLSSPKTHIVNMTSNTAVSLMAVPERFLAAGFSRAFHGGTISGGEAAEMAFSYFQGISEGIRLVQMGAKAADDPQVGALFEMARPAENAYVDHLVPELFGVNDAAGVGKGFGYALSALKLPTWALGKEDDFFKSIAYRTEVNALAHRTARAEGLEGEAFAARLADLKNNPPDSLKLEAFDFAKYQTFTNDLGKGGRMIQSAINNNYALKYVFPFVRTPANIFKYTFERTPLALASASIRADIRAGGARAAQAEARIALGSMLLGSAYMMAASGQITGSGSLDKDQRAMAVQSGWQPYSVKVGDRYYAFNRLDPYGMILGLGADFAEQSLGMNDQDQEQAALAGAQAIAANLASKTYLSGAFDLMASLDSANYKSDLSSYIIRGAFTFVPYSSLLRNTAKAGDPVLRDASAREDDPNAQMYYEFVNQFKRNIPGLSDSLPARLDLYGEEIDTSSGLGMLFDFASPVAVRTAKNDPVDAVILENRIPVSWTDRSIDGIRLTPQEYHDYSKLAGTMARGRLEALIKGSAFKAASDGPEGMKSQLVQRVLSQSREVARKQMVATNFELRNRIVARQIEMQNRLAGQEEVGQ